MGIKDLIEASYDIVTDFLIPIAFALCLLYFFWGVAQYLRAGAAGEKATEEGRRIMVWGVAALFVVFSIWGIIRFIRSEVGLSETNLVVPISR
jgi:predicted PurR-regulated permease PerM